jgi:hypothetical protein
MDDIFIRLQEIIEKLSVIEEDKVQGILSEPINVINEQLKIIQESLEIIPCVENKLIQREQENEKYYYIMKNLIPVFCLLYYHHEANKEV